MSNSEYPSARELDGRGDHTDMTRTRTKVTASECQAMRLLFRDNADRWSRGVLRMTFQVGSQSVRLHLTGGCKHADLNALSAREIDRMVTPDPDPDDEEGGDRPDDGATTGTVWVAPKHRDRGAYHTRQCRYVDESYIEVDPDHQFCHGKEECEYCEAIREREEDD